VRYLLVLLAACGAATSTHSTRRSPTEGAITGLVRDHDSGDPLGAADVTLQRAGAPDAAAVSGRDGVYTIDHLKPGRYNLVGTYAGQTVTVRNIDVDPGEATYVDVQFTPGAAPVYVDYNDALLLAITRYHPKNPVSLIEGTVIDSRTRNRIAGAVVTAFGPTSNPDTLQGITDDQGRYKFEPVPPGVYVVSAYYSISGHAQIEVRRSDIHVDADEGVIVPLAIEVVKQ
jgi:hypothetical protein